MASWQTHAQPFESKVSWDSSKVGPVGLLVTSAMQAGGRVLEGFRVQFPSEWRLDILNKLGAQSPLAWAKAEGQIMKRASTCNPRSAHMGATHAPNNER